MTATRLRRGWRSPVGLALLFCFQLACSVFFISDLLSAWLGVLALPGSWRVRESLEIGAALGLVAGLVLNLLALLRIIAERNRAEDRLRVAVGAFQAVLDERFADWGLTPAERDVALFVIKGMSMAEIARLRDASEGTVKAQTNAIYRKAGVTGRPQLVSLFIEDLMDGRAAPGAAAAEAIRRSA
jgi:DNA-binding CsgD family transcriptional regulator